MKLKTLLIAAIVVARLEAETIGIVGGQAPPAPYAALVTSDGTVTPLTGGNLPASGSIESVGMNSSGAGIIGGGNYAALVTPNSTTLTQLTGGNISAQSLNSVAINNSGAGIIGGQAGTFDPPYAAIVTPNSTTLTPVTGFPIYGFIRSVAINNSGTALIGGQDTLSTFAYAALVDTNSPTPTSTPLSGGSLPLGQIQTVAINNSGMGIIGGQSGGGATYAALVTPNSTTLTQLSGGGLPPTGLINSVAINSSGTGLIGGRNTTTSASFAALVEPNNTTPIALTGGNLPALGTILSVAINSSGEGIIGGGSTTPPNSAYAARVAPNGTLTQLTGGGLPPTGLVNSVAINSAGAGLIGGSTSSPTTPYVALVAPNGTLTQILSGLPALGSITSIAFIGGSGAQPILEAITPTTIGSSSSTFNTQLIAVSAFEAHLSSQSSLRTGKEKESSRFGDAGNHVLVAARGDPVLFEYKEQKTYTLWASPFGDYLHQSKRGSSPKMTNEVLGGLLGFDYHPSNYLVGGGLAFAFNHVHFGQHQGHGNLYQEMAFAYYSYYAKNVWFNVTAWGGMYQFYNKRFAPFLPSVNSHIHGWILDPHGEVATPVDYNDWLIFEPFAMADWVNNWQDSFTERGRSGFQVHMDDHYSSLLRSEAGLRFYETIRYEWGKFVLEEKASYINRTPFHTHTQVNFIGAASSFPVAANLTRIQNLGGAELRAMFLPWDQDYPYGIIDAQVEAGSSFQNYFLSLEIGKNF